MLRPSPIIPLTATLVALAFAVIPLVGCADVSESSASRDTGTNASSASGNTSSESTTDDANTSAQQDANASDVIVYARRGSGSYFEGEPIVVHNLDELSAIDVSDSRYVDETHNPIEAANPSELFDAGFFAAYDLVCAPCEVGSSACVVSVGEVQPKGDGTYEVTFEIERPDGMVTADMAYWLAFIPVSKQ